MLANMKKSLNKEIVKAEEGEDEDEMDDYKIMKIKRSEFGNPVYSRLRENQSYFGKSDMEKKHATLNTTISQTQSLKSQLLSSVDPDQPAVKSTKLNTIVAALVNMPELVSARGEQKSDDEEKLEVSLDEMLHGMLHLDKQEDKEEVNMIPEVQEDSEEFSSGLDYY